VYLIHEEVIGLVWPHFPASRLPFGHHLNGIVWTLMVLAIVLVLATGTWYCVEEPFRRLGSLLARAIERQGFGSRGSGSLGPGSLGSGSRAPRPQAAKGAPLRARPVAG
jgi:peptidoglycan/LPS O-acetylase OafA/YrhL